MKIPNINCKIELSATINPSESPNKIKKAISNVFLYSKINTESFLIIAQSKDLNSLERVYEEIHSKKSQKVFRRNLEKNLKNDTTWFYLNKQAAYAERIAICEEEDESPMGPIKVTLTSSSIDRLVDWIVSRES